MWKEIIKRINAETDVSMREEILDILEGFRDAGFEYMGNEETVGVRSKEGIIDTEFMIEGILSWALKYVGERMIGTRLTSDDHAGYRVDVYIGDAKFRVDIGLGHFKDRHYVDIFGIKTKELSANDVAMLKELLEVF